MLQAKRNPARNTLLKDCHEQTQYPKFEAFSFNNKKVTDISKCFWLIQIMLLYIIFINPINLNNLLLFYKFIKSVKQLCYLKLSDLPSKNMMILFKWSFSIMLLQNPRSSNLVFIGNTHFLNINHKQSYSNYSYNNIFAVCLYLQLLIISFQEGNIKSSFNITSTRMSTSIKAKL